jgi:hypothetical protein
MPYLDIKHFILVILIFITFYKRPNYYFIINIPTVNYLTPIPLRYNYYFYP